MSKPKLEKSWYGNILYSFSIFAITSCKNVWLTWFLWPWKEDLKIYNFVVYHKFQKNCFECQKWAGSWQWIKFRKSRDSHPKFEGFSLWGYSGDKKCITSASSESKRENPSNLGGIPWFSEFYPLSVSTALLTFKTIFLEFVVNYKVVDLHVFVPWP